MSYPGYRLARREVIMAYDDLLVNPVPLVEDIDAACVDAEELVAELDYLIDVAPNTHGRIDQQPCFLPMTKMLSDEGWVFAGSGHFSAVYVKNGLAMKIGIRVDDAGLIYAAWCRANSGTAAVPLVYYIDSGANCYVVVMDRLSPFVKDDHAEHAADFEAIQRAFSSWAPPRTKPKDTPAETAAAIKRFFEGVAQLDFHEDNVMLTRDGELVITDPLSYMWNAANDNEGTYTNE